MGEALYRMPVTIDGWVYVKAASEEEALQKGARLKGRSILLLDQDGGSCGDSVPVCGKPWNDPDYPDISLSPAMEIGDTVAEVWRAWPNPQYPEEKR